MATTGTNLKKLLPIGLLALLLYHTLAFVLVCAGAWWQAEQDLSEKLRVYRSTDSLVEFQIPLNQSPGAIARTTSDGFRYKGHYYSVVSLEVRADTLFIAGLELRSQTLWPNDLLSFLDQQVGLADKAGQKAGQLLKFLLKEYAPATRPSFCFWPPVGQQADRIAYLPRVVTTRALPVHAPPPRA